jgi:hypothetical protein
MAPKAARAGHAGQARHRFAVKWWHEWFEPWLAVKCVAPGSLQVSKTGCREYGGMNLMWHYGMQITQPHAPAYPAYSQSLS